MYEALGGALNEAQAEENTERRKYEILKGILGKTSNEALSHWVKHWVKQIRSIE